MGLEISMDDFEKMCSDLQKMAILLEANSQSREVDKALVKAAKIVREDMKKRASTDPKIRAGALYSSISSGKPGQARSGVRRIQTGIFKDKMASQAPHAHLVEFGHGGPAPAPPHPFIRPAFDAKEDEAFAIIREELGKAIDNLKK